MNRWRSPRRWPKRRWGVGGELLLSLFLGLAMALFLIHRFDVALRPQLVALSETKLRSQLVLIGEEALAHTTAGQDLAEGELFTLHPNQDGTVGALTVDTIRLNALRAALVSEVVEQVMELDGHDLGVPFGALTGVDLFSSMGPQLPVRVLSVASAQGSYRSEFSGAGINQTLYRIILDVTITARLLLPGGVVEIEVTTPVCVVETVLIGQVPQTYLNVDQ